MYTPRAVVVEVAGPRHTPDYFTTSKVVTMFKVQKLSERKAANTSF